MPKDPVQAMLAQKFLAGEGYQLTICFVAAESGRKLYPPYREKVPAGAKISVMAPLDYQRMNRWPEYDMVLVTMPDNQLQLTVKYRKVSILEFGALMKKFENPDGERSMLFYPPETK